MMSNHRIATRILALALAGLAASVQAQASNVRVVTTCAELATELAGITDAANNNRYLIQLEPGKYECGNQSIVMKEWVDIEGSGVESTLIRGLGNVTHQIDGVTATALITGASNAELRNLSIKVKQPGEDIIGLLNAGSASTRVSHVVLSVVDGDHCWGVLNDNPVVDPANCSDPANPTLTSQPGFWQVDLTASKCSELSVALDNRGRTMPVIRRAYVMGVNSPVDNIGIQYSVQCVEPQLKKVLRDVEASAYGISDPDDAACYGIRFDNTDIDQFQIFNAYIAADNCGTAQTGENIGLRFGDFPVTIWSSQIKAKAGGAPLEIGVQTDGGSLFVHYSTIRGDTHSIRATNGGTVQVGASQLRGSVDAGVSLATCAGVYNTGFGFFPGPACP